MKPETKPDVVKIDDIIESDWSWFSYLFETVDDDTITFGLLYRSDDIEIDLDVLNSGLTNEEIEAFVLRRHLKNRAIQRWLVNRACTTKWNTGPKPDRAVWRQFSGLDTLPIYLQRKHFRDVLMGMLANADIRFLDVLVEVNRRGIGLIDPCEEILQSTLDKETENGEDS